MWIYVPGRRDKRRLPAASLPVMDRQRCPIIEQAYKQAGNSVTANVIETIGRRIREVDAELKAGAAA